MIVRTSVEEITPRHHRIWIYAGPDIDQLAFLGTLAGDPEISAEIVRRLEDRSDET